MVLGVMLAIYRARKQAIKEDLIFDFIFVQGKEYNELAEGYYTVKSIWKLGKAYGVELPICNAVYDILYNEKEPKSILKKLFDRSLKNEFIVMFE